MLQDLHTWLKTMLATVSVHSDPARAINYALNQWQALTRYVDDCALEDENNAAERTLRAVVLGRKNYLHFGSDSGGERGAAIYTLIGTCKVQRHRPRSVPAPCTGPHRRSPGQPHRPSRLYRLTWMRCCVVSQECIDSMIAREGVLDSFVCDRPLIEEAYQFVLPTHEALGDHEFVNLLQKFNGLGSLVIGAEVLAPGDHQATRIATADAKPRS